MILKVNPETSGMAMSKGLAVARAWSRFMLVHELDEDEDLWNRIDFEKTLDNFSTKVRSVLEDAGVVIIQTKKGLDELINVLALNVRKYIRKGKMSFISLMAMIDDFDFSINFENVDIGLLISGLLSIISVRLRERVIDLTNF